MNPVAEISNPCFELLRVVFFDLFAVCFDGRGAGDGGPVALEKHSCQ